MDRKALLEIIADQRKLYTPKTYVERSCCTPDLLKKSDRFIRVLSGIRRSGKSTVLQHIRNQNKERDYYLNFEDERLIHFRVDDFQTLYELFLEQFGPQHTFYFDEIQNITHWERFVRRMHDSGFKIYITGSNARLLSKELGTHLTGRYIQTEVYPFSFREFLIFKNVSPTQNDLVSTTEKIVLKKLFFEYLTQGGFPEFLFTKNSDYIKQLYENILYRDIVVRHKLPNEKVIKELALHCASNIGKMISFNKLKNILNIGSATSIKEYLSYFEDSYLFFSLHRFDFSLKKQIYALKKVYCIDTKLARDIGFRFSQDEGRYLENIVFVELKRQSKNIFYHMAQKECDFLIQEGTKVVEAIQVATNMDNAETKQRELAGLMEAMEIHKLRSGLILTSNEEETLNISLNGRKSIITIKPVWKWLLE